MSWRFEFTEIYFRECGKLDFKSSETSTAETLDVNKDIEGGEDEFLLLVEGCVALA